MNCIECGALIPNKNQFCQQCGAKRPTEEVVEQIEKIKEVEQLEQIQEGKKIKEFKALQEIDKLKKQEETQTTYKKELAYIKETVHKAYEPIVSNHDEENGITQFFGLMIDLVKNPLMSLEELVNRISTKQAWIYSLILMVAGAIVTFSSFNMIFDNLITGLGDCFISVTKLFGGYFTFSTGAELTTSLSSEPFIQELGLRLLIYIVLSHITLIGIMIGLVLIVFRRTNQLNITFSQELRLMIMPLMMLLLGKIGILLIGLISSHLVAYLYLLVMLSSVVLIITQFVNLLGKSPLAIYGMPIIYFISAFIRNTIILRLIMISTAKYALYF